MTEYILKTPEGNYTKDDLNEMTLEALVDLRHYCTKSANEISAKRNDYEVKNEDKMNTSEYWKRISQYKKAMAHIQLAGQYISDLMKTKRCNTHTQEQHWYYYFFVEAGKKVPSWIMNKIIKSVDEACGYKLEDVTNGSAV